MRAPELRLFADELIVDSSRAARATKHGLSYTPEYRAWQQMRLRCTDPEHAAWADYGGRGITVCERWLESVEAFVEDMGQKPDLEHELDRIDNNRGYEPGNCRWATRKENDRNRRSNRHLEFRGERKTIAEWCEALGLRRDTVGKRLASGWSVEDALTKSARDKRANGEGAKQAQKHPCAGCGDPCSFGAERCHRCENQHRGTTVAA